MIQRETVGGRERHLLSTKSRQTAGGQSETAQRNTETADFARWVDIKHPCARWSTADSVLGAWQTIDKQSPCWWERLYSVGRDREN